MSADPCLVVSLSARYLVRAARRAGRGVACIDAYADGDTRRMATAWSRSAASMDEGFAPKALLRNAARLCPPGTGGLVYGSGFESQPDLLARLALDRELLGNAPEVLAHCGDPRRFFGMLERLGIPYPEVRMKRPLPLRPWLSKRSGACGGFHVMPAAACATDTGRYFQRRIHGEVHSLLFLADGRRMLPIGFNRALPAPPEAASLWAYSGAVRLTRPGFRQAEEILEAAQALTRELRLRGLNGIDFIVTPQGWKLLELNPRPTATLSLWDMTPMPSLFEAHMEACRGRMPRSLPRPAGNTAAAVVYAGNPVRIPATFLWPDWCADLPLPGSTVEAGAPLCTVFAAGESAETAAFWAEEMRRSILRRLSAYSPATFLSAPNTVCA